MHLRFAVHPSLFSKTVSSVHRLDFYALHSLDMVKIRIENINNPVTCLTILFIRSLLLNSISLNALLDNFSFLREFLFFVSVKRKNILHLVYFVIKYQLFSTKRTVTKKSLFLFLVRTIKRFIDWVLISCVVSWLLVSVL